MVLEGVDGKPKKSSKAQQQASRFTQARQYTPLSIARPDAKASLRALSIVSKTDPGGRSL